MAIPESAPFGLRDVIYELYGSHINGKTLRDCFADAVAGAFNPSYSGVKDRLSNFRGYGATTYYSAAIAEYYLKNDCGEGHYGSSVFVEIEEGAYTSLIDQQDADNMADAAAHEYANANGTCIPYNSNPPEVSALIFNAMGSTSAEIETTIGENGAGPITERGVCWSASNSSPTTLDSKETAAVTPETNTVNVTGLTPYTGYYWRAYASNANGTAYYPEEGLFYSTEPDN
jgi:hypothetical protein